MDILLAILFPSSRMSKLLNVLNIVTVVATVAVVVWMRWYGPRQVVFPLRVETLSDKSRVGFVRIEPSKDAEPTVAIILDERWRAMDEFGRIAILTREMVRRMAVLKIHDEAGGGEKGWTAAEEFLTRRPDDHPTFLELFNTAHHDLDVYSPEELINWEATHGIPEWTEHSKGDTAKGKSGGGMTSRVSFHGR